MIQYLTRKQLDVSKYDYCIENSMQSRMYAFSWYLDLVTDNWDVLVLNDYEGVMPIPWRRKFFIKYVYPPFWMLELGVFSLKESMELAPFFEILMDEFRFIESRLNTANNPAKTSQYLLNKEMQVLSLHLDHDAIVKNFRKDRQKDVARATTSALKTQWGDAPEKLIHLFKNNVGLRTPQITKTDYEVLHKLINRCLLKKVGEILSVYDGEDHLVASGFFLMHKKTVTLLVSSTDFTNRKNGANTLLISSAIRKYQKDFDLFNFGGSSMPSIAKYFLSFGAETRKYQQIKYHNLPYILSLFKN